MVLILEPAASRFRWERGERRLETPQRLADDLEIATRNRIREREPDKLDVRSSIGHALLRPRQERLVCRCPAAGAEGLLDATPHAVEQPRGDRARCADGTICPRERVHVLERRTALDSLRRTRWQQSRANGQQQHETRAPELQQEMPGSRTAQVPDDSAHGPGLVAVALMVLVE